MEPTMKRYWVTTSWCLTILPINVANKSAHSGSKKNAHRVWIGLTMCREQIAQKYETLPRRLLTRAPTNRVMWRRMYQHPSFIHIFATILTHTQFSVAWCLIQLTSSTLVESNCVGFSTIPISKVVNIHCFLFPYGISSLSCIKLVWFTMKSLKSSRERSCYKELE